MKCCLSHLLILTPVVEHLSQARTKINPRRKTTEINLAAFLAEHTNTQVADMGVSARRSALFHES